MRIEAMNEQKNIYEMRVIRNRERRNRELRRHLIIIAAAAGMMLSIAVFALGAVRSDASDSVPPGPYKYYHSVAVLPSDTVESFAQKTVLSRGDVLNDSATAKYAREIRAINHLEENENPLAGTTLVVPCFTYEIR